MAKATLVELVLLRKAQQDRSASLETKGKAKSFRKIAKEVFGRSSKESTVRHIFSHFASNGEYNGVNIEKLDRLIKLKEANNTFQEVDITTDDTDFSTGSLHLQSWEEEDNAQAETYEEQTITATTDDIYEGTSLDNFCDSNDEHLANIAKRLRTAQRTNTQLRRIQRQMVDKEDLGSQGVTYQEFVGAIAKDLSAAPVYNMMPLPIERKGTTVEILFSDWQIGKITNTFNTEQAINALDYWATEVLRIVAEEQPEKIIFASLGDIAECSLKHGIQSAISTDSTNSEQMAMAIRYVWQKVLNPLMSTGIPFEFVGVQGNHLSFQMKGMDNFYAGRVGYDYTIYSAWQTLAESMGYDHVTWNLPEGVFTTYEIYGKTTVAEHGYELKGAVSQQSMNNLRQKRMNNTEKFIHRLVCGDRHHHVILANAACNGAFFGGRSESGEEYGSVAGFNSTPAQLVFVHQPTDCPDTETIVRQEVIQVAKGYDWNLKARTNGVK